ncbi:MAG: fibronectin type III domain-containing protein [Anaerolineae bacterium]|nr:fibronectin type III domain-containing protein [Anaerolineae bacterium]
MNMLDSNTATNDNSSQEPGIKAASTRRWTIGTVLFSAVALILIAATIYVLFFQPPSLTIKWTTENELDTIGYNLYRAESADGEYVKITDALIPANNDPTRSSEHEFKDTNVKRGTTYFYQLETVGREGNSEFEGPIELTAR